MKNVFEFKIKQPKISEKSDYYFQRVTITMKSPTYVFAVTLNDRLNDPEAQMRLAKAELKVKMIEALINGEWEFE